MITLFRRMREKLIASGSFTKYLLYAIGEILLVVIGILIALQVNNWNQDRLDRNRALEYHQRLADDLSVIISFLETDYSRGDQVHEAIDSAVKILENGSDNDSSRRILDNALGNYFRLSTHMPKLTSYDEMKSSGQLGLIESSELRVKIADFLIFQELVTTVYEDLNTKVNQSDFLDPYVKFRENADFANPVLEYDFKLLAANQKVINTLSRYSFHWMSKSTFSRNLEGAATELKTSVEKELNRLK